MFHDADSIKSFKINVLCQQICDNIVDLDRKRLKHGFITGGHV